ncbi:MAG: arginine--tRNA ligase [Chloroflexota bacterium]|nr:MAG: arginine--tRNA ligase [Chloroflexota bacterium]
MLIRHQIARLLREAGESAQVAGDLPAVAIDDAYVERTNNAARGDYASSLPMRLARAAGMPPAAIAEKVLRRVLPHSAIERIEIAPPGFMNVTLSRDWLRSQVDAIVDADDNFGRIELGNGSRVQIEFVSANPTGYLTAASGRAGALGDALGNVLAFAGYQIEREYYVNDAGSQVAAFYGSVWARYREVFGLNGTIPDNGYHGPAIREIAGAIAEQHGRAFVEMDEATAIEKVGRLGLDAVLIAIKEDLARFGVTFDRWYSEESLHQTRAIDAAVAHLRQRGFLAEREGAIWFTSTDIGDERDHVLVRSNGVPTYMAADIAYHHDKFIVRGFDRVIDIWGADHHGHVQGMVASVEALGVDRSRFTVLLHQMVTIKRGTEIVRMSKRAGDYVALRDVLDEVGSDACRYFFLARTANAHVDFDLELAKRESDDNPVYYVQYGHARTASILRRAEGIDPRSGDTRHLSDDAEFTLIRKLLQFPEIVEVAATMLEPHHLPHYARELAATFSQFYETCRVLGDDPDVTSARLKLVLATKVTLRNCLRLMGMSAPERMDRG